MSQNSRIFLALGSNIGDRIAQLGKAILLLSQHAEIEVKELSSIYETEPVAAFGWFRKDFGWDYVEGVKDGRLCEVTHWGPAPELPKERGG